MYLQVYRGIHWQPAGGMHPAACSTASQNRLPSPRPTGERGPTSPKIFEFPALSQSLTFLAQTTYRWERPLVLKIGFSRALLISWRPSPRSTGDKRRVLKYLNFPRFRITLTLTRLKQINVFITRYRYSLFYATYRYRYSGTQILLLILNFPMLYLNFDFPLFF